MKLHIESKLGEEGEAIHYTSDIGRPKNKEELELFIQEVENVLERLYGLRK